MENTSSVWQHEKSRLQTFRQHGWKPSYNVKPEDLAASGFVYEGEGDTATCVCCKTAICDWAPGDVPATEHEKLKPDCRFVLDPAGCEGDPTAVKKHPPFYDGVMCDPPKNVDSLCISCFKDPKSVVLHPCQHFAVCNTCAPKIQECPMCKRTVSGRFKVAMIQSIMKPAEPIPV